MGVCSVQLIYGVRFIWSTHLSIDKTPSSACSPSLVPLFLAIIAKDLFYCALIYWHIMLLFARTFLGKLVCPLIPINTRVPWDPLECDIDVEPFIHLVNTGSEVFNVPVVALVILQCLEG